MPASQQGFLYEILRFVERADHPIAVDVQFAEWRRETIGEGVGIAARERRRNCIVIVVIAGH